MNYDTTELFAEINAYRRRDMFRKIGRAVGIAASPSLKSPTTACCICSRGIISYSGVIPLPVPRSAGPRGSPSA